MSRTQIILLATCVWLWIVPAHAQTVLFEKWGADYGTISVAVVDTGNFPRELKAAVDSLRRQDGILLDLRKVESFWLWSGTMWKSVKPAFDDYTKPVVILISEKIRDDYPLYHWAKPRTWTRFESSGSKEKAEIKLKTLNGRYTKEGQARMEWLMQNQKKQ